MSNETNEILIDERIWQKWQNKNEANDRTRFKRRVWGAGILLPLLVAAQLIWRFNP